MLLTGATGFLSAYLLAELLEHTDWQITCLVQAASQAEGWTRVISNLENYALWNHNYSGRVRIILGNLDKPKLGLSAEEWDALAEEMDLIFHGAALLNFIYPYQKLKNVNVLGTRQLLELAGHKHLKGFHYISTIGYFMSADLSDNTVFNEQTELSLNDGIYG